MNANLSLSGFPPLRLSISDEISDEDLARIVVAVENMSEDRLVEARGFAINPDLRSVGDILTFAAFAIFLNLPPSLTLAFIIPSIFIRFVNGITTETRNEVQRMIANEAQVQP